MSVSECIEKLVKVGSITRAIADEALDLFERSKGEFSQTMGPASAEAAAAHATAKAMEAGAKKLKYEASKQALAYHRFETDILAHPQGAQAGIMSKLTRDIWGKGGENVWSKSEVVLAQLSRVIEKGLASYSPGILGHSKSQLDSIRNVIYERFGVATGDNIAATFAKGFGEATDEAVARVQAAGKHFEPAENWRVPQFWDQHRVAKVKLEEFKRDFLDEVNRGALKLWDRDTGRPAIADRLEAVVERAYRDIRTNGGGGTFRPEQRTFQFQDGRDGADAWLRLHEKYAGGSNVIGTLTGHLSSMAREIAMAEVIGPNHSAIINAAMVQAREAEAGKRGARKLLNFLESPKAIERTYDVLTGAANAVEGPIMAGIFGGLRSLNTAAQLGGAILSAIPGDTVTSALAASHVGMAPVRLVNGALRELARGGEESKAIAARIGLTAHAMMDYNHGFRFYEDQVAGPETLKALATTVVRAQGLSAWTELLKRTFTMEFTGHLADHAGHSLDALRGVNKPLAEFLDRARISAAEWDAIRATPHLEVEGTRFLDTKAIADTNLRERLVGGIIDERAFAVLEPDARIRAITTGGLQQGTWMGEISRSLFLFKSFSLTMAATHMMRIATTGPIESKIWNGSAFLVLHMIAGMAAMQAKNVVYGKDPENMGTASFWAKAAMAGGGLGIYGDLINSSMTRSGRSPVADIAGPVGGVFEDALRLTSGQVRKLYEGGDTTFGAELNRTLRRYTPKTFYTRLAVDRLIYDQLQTLVDPDYRASFRRMEQRMKTDTGQEFWWGPGQTQPARGPNLGATILK
jgi:hypothetical protein